MKKYEQFIYGFIILFLFLSTLFSILYTLDIFISLKKYSVFLIITGILSLIIIIYGIIKKYYKISKFDVFIILLVIFGIIATIYAIYPKVSLWGSKYRHEGLLVLISYYLIFLLARNIKNQKYIKNIIKTLLLIGLFNIAYGICQTVPVLRKLSEVMSPWMYARGTFGNSNFYGTYMLMQVALSLGLYFYDSKKYYIFVFIYTFGVLLSGCLSCILALGVIYIVIFLYSLIKKKIEYKKTLLTVLAFVFSLLIITYTTESEIIKDLNVFGFEIGNTLKDGIKKEYGSSRIHIWTNTLKKVPEHLLNGAGIDNFLYAFNPRIKTLDHNLSVDKAHNEYLQKLFTEGIFSFITYMSLLIFIFIYGIQNVKKDNIYMPLLLLFIGYSVQAFFNISVIRVAPLFFIFSGLLSCNNEEKI